MKCENCGKDHNGYYGSGRFCSNKCARSYSTKTKRVDINKQVSIKLKGRPSKLKGRKVINRKLPISRKVLKQDNIKKNSIISTCVFCNKQWKTKYIRKFCSKNCQHEHIHKEYIKRWKNGKELGYKGQCSTSKHIRRYIFEKYNNKCSKCGWSKLNPYTNSIPLHLEHKDGNANNNNESNLDLLCPSCHSLTSTYGVLNIGKGRRYYREYKRKKYMGH